MNTKVETKLRRYDIDWLRVLLTLAVLLFHSLRFFNIEGWGIKNATTYMFAEVMVIFISRWLMPVMFLISGIAISYALNKRRAGQFIKDRALRLLVPFLVGLITHLRLQEYISWISQGQSVGSFWKWYPSMFKGLGEFGGFFSWSRGHLWYLEMLFVLSLICIPLVIWLRNRSGQRVLSWIAGRVSSPGALYLVVVLPLILLSATLNPENRNFLENENGGWNLPSYLLFLLSGFVIASSESIQDSIRKIRWISLVAGVMIFFAGAGLILVLGGGDAVFGSPLYLLWTVVSSLSAWACILAILGFGMQHLNVPSPLLGYANEAVLPFYILHQSILWVVGFYVLDWPIPDLAKWAIILVSSFAIILMLYEFLVRRTNVLRFVFGMKPQDGHMPAAAPAAVKAG